MHAYASSFQPYFITADNSLQPTITITQLSSNEQQDIKQLESDHRVHTWRPIENLAFGRKQVINLIHLVKGSCKISRLHDLFPLPVRHLHFFGLDTHISWTGVS